MQFNQNFKRHLVVFCLLKSRVKAFLEEENEEFEHRLTVDDLRFEILIEVYIKSSWIGQWTNLKKIRYDLFRWSSSPCKFYAKLGVIFSRRWKIVSNNRNLLFNVFYQSDYVPRFFGNFVDRAPIRFEHSLKCSMARILHILNQKTNGICYHSSK